MMPRRFHWRRYYSTRPQPSQAELNLKAELPQGQFYPEQVRMAREASRATEYKVKWRIGWGQVIAILVAAAILAGFFLLVTHILPANCQHFGSLQGPCR